MTKNHLKGKILKNIKTFASFKKCGFDYILNPRTGELHKAVGGTLAGSHNLVNADLSSFMGVANLDSFPAHFNFNGAAVPFYDLDSGQLIGDYILDKCHFCFPGLR